MRGWMGAGIAEEKACGVVTDSTVAHGTGGKKYTASLSRTTAQLAVSPSLSALEVPSRKQKAGLG